MFKVVALICGLDVHRYVYLWVPFATTVGKPNFSEVIRSFWRLAVEDPNVILLIMSNLLPLVERPSRFVLAQLWAIFVVASSGPVT